MEPGQIGESSAAVKRPENLKICTSMKMFGDETRAGNNDVLGMDVQKVLEEKVPFHARFYPWYVPANGRKFEKWPKEDLQEEIDDKNEDEDADDSKSEYDNEKESIPEIRRALKNDDEEKEFEKEFDAIEYFNGEVVDLGTYNIFIEVDENDIRKFNWGIKNFKIFHIWNISLNKKKPTFLPWSAKFQSDENRIELEIHSHEENENGLSQADLAKAVHFCIDTRACDVPLFATVDGCRIKYSLLSNAVRVKLEIRAYHKDGSPALDVDGHIRAHLVCRGRYEKYLFDGQTKREGKKLMAANTLTLSPSCLILPRDFNCVTLDMSLKDKDGKFWAEGKENVQCRTIAVDEQHYIECKEGYIILTTIWSCLCVDSKHGICTCPGGTAMGTFQAEQNDSVEDVKDKTVDYTYRPITTCSEDDIEGVVKRLKISKPREICSTAEEATIGDEDSK